MRRLPPCFVLIGALALSISGCSALVSPRLDELGEEASAGTPASATDQDPGAGADTAAPGDPGGSVNPGPGAGPSMPPELPPDATCGSCNDDIDCTVDRCEDGICVHQSTDSLCAGGQVCIAAVGCTAATCTSDLDCDDRNPCNGQEICAAQEPTADARGCAGGAALDCDDGISCTEDSCEQGVGCLSQAQDSLCDDGIGCTEDICEPDAGCLHLGDDDRCDFCYTGSFCDPARGCLVNQVSNEARDCTERDPCTYGYCSIADMACVHEPRDDDGDGAPAAYAGTEFCGGSDCDDGDPRVFPEALELCNGVDDNCNDLEDEDCQPVSESCDDATTLTLVNGLATAEGNFRQLIADHGTACGENGGHDAVYRIELDGVNDVFIDTLGSETATVLAFASDCSNDDFFLRCAGSISEDQRNSRLIVHRYSRSEMYILVDTPNEQTVGAYKLRVRVKSAAGDQCGEEALDISSGATVFGEIGLERELTLAGPSCQGALSLPAQGRGMFQITSSANQEGTLTIYSTDFRPYLMGRQDCRSNDELFCQRSAENTSTGFNETSLTLTSEEAIDYRLLVWGGGPGDDYRLVYRPGSRP